MNSFVGIFIKKTETRWTHSAYCQKTDWLLCVNFLTYSSAVSSKLAFCNVFVIFFTSYEILLLETADKNTVEKKSVYSQMSFHSFPFQNTLLSAYGCSIWEQRSQCVRSKNDSTLKIRKFLCFFPPKIFNQLVKENVSTCGRLFWEANRCQKIKKTYHRFEHLDLMHPYLTVFFSSNTLYHSREQHTCLVGNQELVPSYFWSELVPSYTAH